MRGGRLRRCSGGRLRGRGVAGFAGAGVAADGVAGGGGALSPGVRVRPPLGSSGAAGSSARSDAAGGGGGGGADSGAGGSGGLLDRRRPRGAAPSSIRAARTGVKPAGSGSSAFFVDAVAAARARCGRRLGRCLDVLARGLPRRLLAHLGHPGQRLFDPVRVRLLDRRLFRRLVRARAARRSARQRTAPRTGRAPARPPRRPRDRGEPRRIRQQLRRPRGGHGLAEPRPLRRTRRAVLDEAQRHADRPRRLGRRIAGVPVFHVSALVGGGHRHPVGFGEEATPVAVLEIEDHVERPMDVIGETGRLRDHAFFFFFFFFAGPGSAYA